MAAVHPAHFVIPRKKNSAIPITKPASRKTAQSPAAQPPPSAEPAPAFSGEFGVVDDITPRAGAAASTSTHIDLPSDDQHIGVHSPSQAPKEGTSDFRGTYQGADDPKDGPVDSTFKVQPVTVINRQRMQLPTADSFPRTSITVNGTETHQPTTASGPSAPVISKHSTPISATATSSTLDIYAPNYVPDYLKAINDSPAQLRASAPLTIINYAQYIAGFAGYSALRPLDPFIPPPIEGDASTSYSLDKGLDLHMYGTHLWTRMMRELNAQSAELQGLAMYGVPFTAGNAALGMFTFVIPGIRENNPRMDLGDTVLIRPWSQAPNEGLAPLARAWYASAGARNGRLAPGFAGWEYHAVVMGLQRSKEEVVLRLDEYAPHNTRFCNIGFVIQDHKCTPFYRAISHIAHLIMQEDCPRSWLRSILFPAKIHGVLQSNLTKGSFDLAWYDRQLNFEQQKAVDAIVKNEYGQVPFIISGPPGTGKTKSLVEACLQLLRLAESTNERCNLLVCAPSDSAADTIASRLKAHLTQFELFRLNNCARSFAEVPEQLMLHSYIENDLFAIPDFATMMRFKVVVTTSRDADMLVQARMTNVDLAMLTTQLSVITSSVRPQPLRLHWSALLLDEAAQATEPEALIPLTVVQPGAELPEGFHSLPQVIMAGDEHQLGPSLSLTSDAGLRYTLFQRLFERALYADHPLSRKNGSRPLTASMLPIPRPPFVNLIRNYRSHPAILAVPSVLFYHDSLIPEVTTISPVVLSWEGWRGRNRRPVLFVQNESEDAVESILAGNGSGAGALVNYREAVIASNIVKCLVKARDLKNSSEKELDGIAPYEITVMSPFRAQVNHLRKELRAAGYAAVNVGPLEAFQGLESRVVILCTTRTRRDGRDPGRFVKEDQARGIGLIDDAKKFNVAITRAKEGLIVIGDQRTLLCTGDRSWAAFLVFCERNGCVDQSSSKDRYEWKGTPSDVPPGRLERAMAYAAEAKDREAIQAAVPTGFGYPTSTGRVLRGNLPTSDEDMWADGMRMADENNMSEEDEEEHSIEEDAGRLPSTGSTPSPPPPPPPTVTVDGEGSLVSAQTNRNKKEGSAKAKNQQEEHFISFSPEATRGEGKENVRIDTEDEPVFDGDLETEIKKKGEGCEMQ